MTSKPKLRLWADEHRAILRWLLRLPVLWRIAFRLITENLPHDESGTECLVCAAAKRFTRDTHVLTMNQFRQLYCKKCSLPHNEWKRKPKCRRNAVLAAPAPSTKSTLRVIPLNWD